MAAAALVSGNPDETPQARPLTKHPSEAKQGLAGLDSLYPIPLLASLVPCSGEKVRCHLDSGGTEGLCARDLRRVK